jgi:hypothetical protein
MGVGGIVSFLPIDKKSSGGINRGDAGWDAVSLRLTGAVVSLGAGRQKFGPVRAIAILGGGRIESCIQSAGCCEDY